MINAAEPLPGVLAHHVPAARARLVATGVFGFIQAWNEFVFALVLNPRPEAMTLRCGCGRSSTERRHRTGPS